MSKDSIQALHSSLRMAFPPPFIEPCAQFRLLCFWVGFVLVFYQPNNHLFVALRQNFIQNKWCKKRQWQSLVSVRIAKPSVWLTVNSSLPRLLAELIRLRVLKFFANLYMHRSEAQIDDGTTPCCHQVSLSSEHLPDVVSLPPCLGCSNLILCGAPLSSWSRRDSTQELKVKCSRKLISFP